MRKTQELLLRLSPALGLGHGQRQQGGKTAGGFRQSSGTLEDHILLEELGKVTA